MFCYEGGVIRAVVLMKPAPIEEKPLVIKDLPVPSPGPGEVLIRISACGMCHTDLHTIEGELTLPKLPLVPGHEIVGRIEETGAGVSSFAVGDRVGLPWLYHACGTCSQCLRGSENLCENPLFTGYHVDGGYAEYVLAESDFTYRLPDVLSDEEMTPLLCGGIIGYRALRLADVGKGKTIGLYGFGNSAHIAIQIARHWGCRVYVFTRSEKHKKVAQDMGAVWVGEAADDPAERLDRAIIFAPAGRLVPEALRVLRWGGTLSLAGIYMTPIPELDYNNLVYGERTIRSVTASTRNDARELLRLAEEIPLTTNIEVFPLEDANRALRLMKESKLDAGGVLRIT
jgi:propanol-preferring alcohol dehydrogenase